MERKLTAILSADVKGYSRLMGEDEEATIRTLTVYQQVMTTLIQQHRGRVVDSPGDNLLAEFASAVDAVRCAVEIQHELKVRNADLPVQRKMEFRIGINVGDVVVEGEKIYGDGVNIAARLEGLAEAGGICVSGTVYDQVKNKLTLGYEYLGEQTVKNIAEPVRVWRVEMEPAAAAGHKDPSPRGALINQGPTEGQGEGASGRAGVAKTPYPNPFDEVYPERSRRAQDRLPPQGGKEPQEKRRGGRTHLTRVVLVLVGLAVSVGGIAWYLLFPIIRLPHSAIHNQEALALPYKPSIAVLPFVNISEDPKQEYFSDGMTDTLITDLSKLSGLFVIARNSTFAYKGKAVKPQQVSQELGVQYVLEGSVQKADTRVRIIAQLVDATTGHHLWAEHYDRGLKDIFALQDEITQKIVVALGAKLLEGEQGRVGRVLTDNLKAYAYFAGGSRYFFRFTKEANAQAQQMWEQSIELDPQFAAAHTVLGWTYFFDWIFQWSQDPQALEQALTLARRAIALDDSLPMAHSLLGTVYLLKKQYERALVEAERAITLDPNNADAYANLGYILAFAGQPEEAMRVVEKGMRLNPRFPAISLSALGMAYLLTGRYEAALDTLKKALPLHPNFLLTHETLVVIYSELNQTT